MQEHPAQQVILKQLSYLCPGLHGPESRQRIERRTFGDFMGAGAEADRIIIPLFQRRYCWDGQRVAGWWKDVVCGKRDHLGIHNSGNIVVKRSSVDGNAWICIDGQQRLTTTSLLVAALRDAVLTLEDLWRQQEQEELRRRWRRLLRTTEQILYHDRKGPKVFKQSLHVLEDGDDLKFCRLVPSYSDRKSFFACVTEGLRLEEKTAPESTDDGAASLQRSAKRYFDVQVRARIDLVSSSNGDSFTTAAVAALLLQELESLVELAMSKMGLTLVEVQNEIDMPQVFLWLQEKSLFGEGAILYNPTPGIDFAASDLVRNLILASVMNEKLSAQETFYRERWLFPLERRFSGPDKLTDAISKFVDGETKEAERHISKLEETANAMCKMTNPAKEKVKNMLVYAKFYSIYEQRLRGKAMLPPRTKTKAGKTDEKEEAELRLDPKIIFEVSNQLLDELTDFVKKDDGA